MRLRRYQRRGSGCYPEVDAASHPLRRARPCLCRLLAPRRDEQPRRTQRRRGRRELGGRRRHRERRSDRSCGCPLFSRLSLCKTDDECGCRPDAGGCINATPYCNHRPSPTSLVKPNSGYPINSDCDHVYDCATNSACVFTDDAGVHVGYGHAGGMCRRRCYAYDVGKSCTIGGTCTFIPATDYDFCL